MASWEKHNPTVSGTNTSPSPAENPPSISGGSSSTSSDNVPYSRTQFIRDVQACTGSKVDGIAGSETIRNTVTVSAAKNRKHSVVTPIQKRLDALGYHCGAADGIAGPKFTNAVNQYQSKVLKYNTLDGEMTARKKMWQSLLGMI